MTSALGEALDHELLAQGLRVEDLQPDEYEFAHEALRSLVARLKARRGWEQHIGELLTHQQVLALTGWTKQALSQAVRDHRVLRLVGEHGTHLYPLSAFDDEQPARPLAGMKPVLAIWDDVDPRGWAVASWLVSPQPELAGRTPREVLLDPQAQGARVVTLARQAAQRLAS